MNLQAVGLAPETDQEILELRKAYEHLESVIKDVENTQTHLEHLNIGLAKEQLKVTLDYAREAKKILARVGKQTLIASVPGTKEKKDGQE